MCLGHVQTDWTCHTGMARQCLVTQVHAGCTRVTFRIFTVTKFVELASRMLSCLGSARVPIQKYRAPIWWFLKLRLSVGTSLSQASFFSFLSLGAAVRTVCPLAICEAGQSPPLLTYLLYKLYGGYLSFLFRSAQAWPDDEFWLLVQDHFPQPGQRCCQNQPEVSSGPDINIPSQ